MKKIQYYISIFIGLLFTCCEESELKSFKEKDAVYFQLMKIDYANVSYDKYDDWLDYKSNEVIVSFGAFPEDHSAYKEKDTITLQVNIMGMVTSEDRYFKIKVNAEKTTAEEGLHYDDPGTRFLFPADTVRTSFPIVFHNHESLGEEPYVLYLELEESDDFDLGLEGRLEARILLYDDVVQPPIWDDYLFKHFGPYSQAKHKVITHVNGGIPIPVDLQEYIALYKEMTMWRSKMNEYLEENEVYDEYGLRVEPY